MIHHNNKINSDTQYAMCQEISKTVYDMSKWEYYGKMVSSK